MKKAKKIRCINAGGNFYIKVGTIYKVLSENKRSYTIINDHGNRECYSKNYFELVESGEPYQIF